MLAKKVLRKRYAKCNGLVLRFKFQAEKQISENLYPFIRVKNFSFCNANNTWKSAKFSDVEVESSSQTKIIFLFVASTYFDL
jgi:hypothetical protein